MAMTVLTGRPASSPGRAREASRTGVGPAHRAPRPSAAAASGARRGPAGGSPDAPRPSAAYTAPANLATASRQRCSASPARSRSWPGKKSRPPILSSHPASLSRSCSISSSSAKVNFPAPGLRADLGQQPVSPGGELGVLAGPVGAEPRRDLRVHTGVRRGHGQHERAAGLPAHRLGQLPEQLRVHGGARQHPRPVLQPGRARHPGPAPQCHPRAGRGRGQLGQQQHAPRPGALGLQHVLHPCQIALKIPGHLREQHELAFDSQKTAELHTNRVCMKPGMLHRPTLIARVPRPGLHSRSSQPGLGTRGFL
jgi:hypothetical protein